MSATSPDDILRATGVPVRKAGDGDGVAGVAPRWVAMPSDVRETAVVMRAAASLGLAVVPLGGRTKARWGHPPTRCDLVVDTRGMDRVLEHEAGDLVVRVEAGTTMDKLAAALAAAHQELALDVPLDGATVGGTLATATAGPRALRYGTARDLLIGVTVVLADGTIAKSGGKVVKNVAGYDLGKLFTGSYGTLGIIAEAAFRLHPIASERVFVTSSHLVRDDLGALLQRITAAPEEVCAVEVDWPDPREAFTLTCMIEGVGAVERAHAVRRLLGREAHVGEEPPSGWGRMPGDEFVVEVRVRPDDLYDAMLAVEGTMRLTGVEAAVRGWAAPVATLRVALRTDGDFAPGEAAGAAFVTSLRSVVEPAGRVVVVTAPEEIARRVDRFGATGALALMRRVKERFDPDHRLSPGRFVGGLSWTAN
ncbi:glycolate oxidase FAD binding subunit [Sinosporangium album]|uniref:Glycolate oxidase FAD binding subunit n=1 Tax=Sinosporangium album TaxID=504805 RepID=A0A1G7S487_9ACTN|nr:FAD-binding oxidoreductase [Sinosporangium album]SDG17791.1 glycolate oxidase FAD binding subunit [Sinosporangium album]